MYKKRLKEGIPLKKIKHYSMYEKKHLEFQIFFCKTFYNQIKRTKSLSSGQAIRSGTLPL